MRTYVKVTNFVVPGVPYNRLTIARAKKMIAEFLAHPRNFAEGARVAVVGTDGVSFGTVVRYNESPHKANGTYTIQFDRGPMRPRIERIIEPCVFAEVA